MEHRLHRPTGAFDASPADLTGAASPARDREARALIPVHGDRRRGRIGLLGGSYNPAHEGHRHVARLACKHLRLHQVWLLVSPGNPLKPRRGMASLADRLASAGRIADGRRIVATDIERALGTVYTADTLRLLGLRFPRARFVWLMGADNLEQLPRWRRWREVAAGMPFAVLPRPTYNHRALAGHAARLLSGARRAARLAPVLADLAAPAWVFLPVPQHTASASAIRAVLSGVQDHRQKAARSAHGDAQEKCDQARRAPQAADHPARAPGHSAQEGRRRRPEAEARPGQGGRNVAPG